MCSSDMCPSLGAPAPMARERFLRCATELCRGHVAAPAACGGADGAAALLALWRRVFLGAHVASWALCPLLNIINWMNILLVFSRPLHFRVFISVLYAIPCFGYTLGFCYCFSQSLAYIGRKHGRCSERGLGT